MRPELIVQHRRAIKEAALDKTRDIYREMVERAKMATLTAEFYEPNAVRQRAAFQDPERVSALVVGVSAAPPVALLNFARLAVASRDVPLAAVVLESVQAREAAIPDSIARGVKRVIGAMPLPESEQGRKLVNDIIGAEQDAQRAIAGFQTGRADVMAKIARGLRQRND
jgi:anion-transporting  ArsA/GET3 family ATPase